MLKTPATKKPRTKLTVKQKRFVAEYVKDGNGTRAARESYEVANDVVAGAVAYENLKKPQVSNAIAEALPDELLSLRHLELLNKREVFAVRMPDGRMEKELTDLPDTMAVSKGLDMAYKIKGSYAPEKVATVHMFVLPDEEKKRLDDILNDNV